MDKKNRGFFDTLSKTAEMMRIVDMSRDKNGKPDPIKASAIAATKGYKARDIFELGGILDAEGAFDKNNNI